MCAVCDMHEASISNIGIVRENTAFAANDTRELLTLSFTFATVYSGVMRVNVMIYVVTFMYTLLTGWGGVPVPHQFSEYSERNDNYYGCDACEYDDIRCNFYVHFCVIIGMGPSSLRTSLKIVCR